MGGRISGDAHPGGGTFARLAFQQFRKPLYRYLLYKLRNAQSAEDLTQEVYLRLLRTADAKSVKHPQAYVFGVAFNVLYEFRLRERGTPFVYDSDAVAHAAEHLSDEAPTPQELSEQQGRQRWMDELLARLSPMQQAVLLMAKRQDMPHAEIARRLGISVGTVRKHLARAVAHFRRQAHEQP